MIRRLKVIQDYDNGGYIVARVTGRKIEYIVKCNTEKEAQDYLKWYRENNGYKLEGGNIQEIYKIIKKY